MAAGASPPGSRTDAMPWPRRCAASSPTPGRSVVTGRPPRSRPDSVTRSSSGLSPKADEERLEGPGLVLAAGGWARSSVSTELNVAAIAAAG